MATTTKKLIEEYYSRGLITTLDTTRLINHDVVFYRKNNANKTKVQKTVKDAFKFYIKVDDNWLSVLDDIVLVFVIENSQPETKPVDYNGSKIHEAIRRIQEESQELLKKRKEYQQPSEWKVGDIPDNILKFLRPSPPACPSGYNCSKCGMRLEGVMGYCCPEQYCPAGMGGTYCSSNIDSSIVVW